MADENKSISYAQHLVLAEAFLKGYNSDMGYTMMAIAYQESKAGKYLINTETDDYGVMGININSAASRMGVNGAWKRNLLAQRLLFDTEFNMSMALEELKYWNNYHKGNWRMVVRSYNAGFNTDNGIAYQKKISYYVNMFKHC